MASNEGFQPDWASAPGDTIVDILGERGLSLLEFARRMEETPERISDLIEGRAPVTLGIARRLAKALGASVEYWMSRDFQYRNDAPQLEAGERDWIADLPIGDMIKFGWIYPKPHPSEELAACLRFFDVPSIGAWRNRYGNLHQLAAFRTSRSFDSRPSAVAAWLRRGEVESAVVNCRPWNRGQFEASLPRMRKLTRERDPQKFVPELQAKCAESGVAVAIVRAPGGCRASGATRFLSPEKAVLQLSFRYLRDDQFWFTFFHEAAHLVLHAEKGLFIEGLETPSTKEEQEANDFAARMLVPPEFQYALLSLPLNSREVIRFAQKIGVSPGIIVGQLQHHRRLKQNQLNSLKRGYIWAESTNRGTA
jgi:HTH-type transcriptional regulator / antitoxin HigA